MRYFAPESAAGRYAKGRPYFHPLVIGRVRESLSIAAPLPKGLDACCGTGLSTLALGELAAHVVGADLSAEMLALAPRGEGLSFCRASAEELPFADGTFDVVTVCQALHWLDRRRFLAEARRVLRPGGLLVIYDDYVTGRMAGCEEFRRWHDETYRHRFPAPPRGRIGFAEGEPAREGFRLLLEESFEHEIEFTPATLVDYLTSHSNIIAAVEGGGLRIEEVRGWLVESVSPFFGARASAGFIFRAVVWCLGREH